MRGRRTLKYRHIEETARLKYAARWPRKNSARLRSISRRWATGGTIIRTSRRPPETDDDRVLRSYGGAFVRVKPDWENGGLQRNFIDKCSHFSSMPAPSPALEARPLPGGEVRLTEGAGGFQARYFVPGQADFERDFLGMLPEF